jgi:hypothetical protein
MLNDKKAYDAELHARNQQKPGPSTAERHLVNNSYEKLIYKTENNCVLTRVSRATCTYLHQKKIADQLQLNAL